jgi:hypothetical protein
MTDFHDGDTFGFVGDEGAPTELPPLEVDSDIGRAASKARAKPAGRDTPTVEPGYDEFVTTREPKRSPRSVAGVLVLVALVGAAIALQFLVGGKAANTLFAGPRAVPGKTGTPAVPAPSIVNGPVTLRGPGGNETLPLGEPAIVHVWLQGCSDCMGSFNAYRDMRSRGELDFGVPVVNVAYGNASEEWAAEYGVDERLVFDSGQALVQPMGIGTFTTLVMDAEGTVVHRDYPRDRGYAKRVRAALQTLQLQVEAD